MGAEEFPSVPFNSNAMDNAEYTDTDLVFAVRKALASVQNVSVATDVTSSKYTMYIYVCVSVCVL